MRGGFAGGRYFVPPFQNVSLGTFLVGAGIMLLIAVVAIVVLYSMKGEEASMDKRRREWYKRKYNA